MPTNTQKIATLEAWTKAHDTKHAANPLHAATHSHPDLEADIDETNQALSAHILDVPPVDPPTPVDPLPEPTHIISPTGSDSTGTGSLSSPWQSLKPFLSLNLQPGATLGCRGGDYPAVAGNRDHYVTNRPGTAAKRITLRQYQNEKPIFHGGAGGSGAAHFLALRGSSDFWTLAGIELVDYVKKLFGIVNLGHDFGDPTITKGPDGTIIRDVTVRFPASSSIALNGEHAIYVNRMTKNTLIEDAFLEGCTAMQAGGAGVHIYPDSITNTTLRRVRARRWDHGVQMSGVGVVGTVIEWCTFWDNFSEHIDAYEHGLLTLRNNVGEPGTQFLDLHGSPGNTISINNFGDGYTSPGTLNADGSLQAGSAAIGGAHDGSDAGAIPFAA